MDFLNALLATLGQFVAILLVTINSYFASPLVVAPPPDPTAFPEAPLAPEQAETLSETTTLPIEESESTTPSSNELINVNELSRRAAVNILCVGNRTVRSASGSGVFIDSRGIVITNAHVGQFFLMRDYPTPNAVRCMIRAGSPATNAYTAELLYLPPAWIDDNASKFNQESAKGTGKHDYAFLRITGATEGKLPESFPALDYSAAEPRTGEAVILAAYPSDDLSGRAIIRNLLTMSTFTTIKKLFSFTPPDTVDVFSIGGTEISQGGASGGGAVRARDGKLIGVITLATEAADVLERDLRAITLSHISRSLAEHGEGSITSLLTGDLEARAKAFNATLAPDERTQLIDALND